MTILIIIAAIVVVALIATLLCMAVVMGSATGRHAADRDYESISDQIGRDTDFEARHRKAVETMTDRFTMRLAASRGRPVARHRMPAGTR